MIKDALTVGLAGYGEFVQVVLAQIRELLVADDAPGEAQV